MERVFTCPDCGVLVKTTAANKQRCRECAENRHRKIAREAGARLRQRAREGVKPKPQDPYQFYDSEENIQKCLSCTLPECKNCLHYVNRKWAREKAERMAENG